MAATWDDLCRAVWPRENHEMREHLLWESSAFPFGSPGTVFRQLWEAKQNGRGNPDTAILLGYRDMDRLLAMRPDEDGSVRPSRLRLALWRLLDVLWGIRRRFFSLKKERAK